jgi:hypothetical protein
MADDPCPAAEERYKPPRETPTDVFDLVGSAPGTRQGVVVGLTWLHPHLAVRWRSADPACDHHEDRVIADTTKLLIPQLSRSRCTPSCHEHLRDTRVMTLRRRDILASVFPAPCAPRSNAAAAKTTANDAAKAKFHAHGN